THCSMSWCMRSRRTCRALPTSGKARGPGRSRMCRRDALGASGAWPWCCRSVSDMRGIFMSRTVTHRKVGVIGERIRSIDRRIPCSAPAPGPSPGLMNDSTAAPVGFTVSYARLVVDHVRAKDLDHRPVLAALGLTEADSEHSPR